MRLMSFRLTTGQILGQSKTVTRRLGWTFLQPEDLIQAVEKSQGLKKGEQVRRLAVLRVVSVRRERLGRMLDEPAYGQRECEREGFPMDTPQDYVDLIRRTHGAVTNDTVITRIEFEYVHDKLGGLR